MPSNPTSKKWSLTAKIGVFASAISLVFPFASIPNPVHAETVKVKAIVTDNMSWATRNSSADTDTQFTFNISKRFKDYSGLTLVSSDSSMASGSVTGNIATITISKPGSPVFTLSGTDVDNNMITDTFGVKITKLGDFTGDGLVTTADALFISRYLAGKETVSEDEKLMMDINGDGKVTNADAVALTTSYVGGKDANSGVTSYTAIFQDINDLPLALGVNITGLAEIDKVVTGAYRYFDVEEKPEAQSLLQWYSGDNADGSGKSEISGANSSTYTVKQQDGDKYLFFGVTPVESGIVGKQVISAASTKIAGTTAPTFASLTPVNGLSNVDATISLISITFNKDIFALNKNITIRKLSDNSVVTTRKANETGVAVAGNKADITITGLEENTDYYVEIEEGAFKDASGNPFVGISGSSTWKFTTVDNPPTLISSIPSNSAVGINSSMSSISMTFSENVTAVSDKKVMIYTSSDNNEVASYSANDLNNVTISGKQVTIKAPALLASTSYYVKIDAGAFIDASSNPYAGITSNSGWSFTTSATVTATMTAETYPASLNQDNLDAALITLSVTGDSFKDDAGAADFTLNNAPAGLNIALAYVSDGKAYLLLEHDWVSYTPSITDFSITAKANAMTQGVAVTSNVMTISTVAQTLNLFFSEYLDGGDGRIAIELYYKGDGNPSHKAEGYEIEVQKYMKATNTIQKSTRSIFPVVPAMPYIFIDSVFYDAMDITPITYFNDDLSMFNPTQFETTALILKKNGQIIDVLGTPNATSAIPILAGGGTLVRKQGTIGGMGNFALNHWIRYPKETYQYLGSHTP
ncbi:Ig-like domain-containing protein [Paenibacillus sp. WQ 127069]|uniref:Ig-like domain-containing protein n=1 Tax=Paenibacillus baimaensis TaxID=2982185 RepID=A0ABT2UAH6_9BACL|nr:Ig-like domain-containing protein [Paenibacillus sp. WQ 127069]MCU6791572.1 Ig-like domain-containing protein [Paenibacillus sp. WQ 127069]